MHVEKFDERWRSKEKRYVLCPGCEWEYTVNVDGRLRLHERKIPGSPSWSTAKEVCPYAGRKVDENGEFPEHH